MTSRGTLGSWPVVGLALALSAWLTAWASQPPVLVIDSNPLGDVETVERMGGGTGDQVIGGGRDLVERDGVVRVAWDGTTIDPGQLDCSGLGGVDLTLDGVRDRFVLQVTGSGPPAVATLTVYSDFDRASAAALVLGAAGAVVVPFASLRPTSAQGADLSDVGAITLEISGSSAWLRLGPITVEPATDALADGGGDDDRPARRLVAARAVVTIGDVPDGGGGLPVAMLSQPTTSGPGMVACAGDLDDPSNDDEFVWVGNAISYFNSATGPDATSIENTMGVADDGNFIASIIVAAGSLDSVITGDGMLLAETDPAPGLPGQYISFCSRPTMLPSGVAHWVSGYANTPGASATARVLYRSTDTVTPVITPILKSGDVVNGFVVDSDFGFNYFFSDSGSHHIQILDTTEDVYVDTFIYLDGAFVAREGDPNGSGDNWDNFDSVQVNDRGNYLVTGDTDGDTGSDEFIAYNGTIVLREGDTVGSVELVTPAWVELVSLNNADQAVFVWDTATSHTMFFAADASNPADAEAVVAVGDEIDLDGDGVADATLTDFNETLWESHSMWLAENGWAYVNVNLDYGSGDVETILKLTLPVFLFADDFESGTTGAWSTTVGG